MSQAYRDDEAAQVFLAIETLRSNPRWRTLNRAEQLRQTQAHLVAQKLRFPNLAGLQRFNDGGRQAESCIRGFVDRRKVLTTYFGPTRYRRILTDGLRSLTPEARS